MKNSDDILKELTGIAPKLSSLQKVNSFRVPENYFVNFTNEILEKVKFYGIQEELKIIAPELAKVERKATTEIPRDYFTSFSTNLMKKIQTNELAEVAPVLSQLEKVNVFEAPIHYFSKFSEQILKKVSSEQKHKVASAPKWAESLTHLIEGFASIVFKPKYSLALAGMTAVIIVGVMMFNKAEQCNDLDCKMASLTDAEINSYLDNNPDAYSEEVFETVGDNSTVSSVQSYKDALKDLSDDELNNAILD